MLVSFVESEMLSKFNGFGFEMNRQGLPCYVNSPGCFSATKFVSSLNVELPTNARSKFAASGAPRDAVCQQKVLKTLCIELE